MFKCSNTTITVSVVKWLVCSPSSGLSVSGVKPDYIIGIHCFSVKHQHYRVRADIAEKLLT